MRARASAELPPLTLALETATLRALASVYADLNHSLFAGRLRRPGIELTDAEGRLGCWRGDQRTLTFARSLVLDHPWGVVVEVLKHEMAHQFTFEVLGATGEEAHGVTFRRVCQERGIDARAAGVPNAPEGHATAGEEAALDRIRKLLALAESPNEHEAQAAAQAAQRLMLKHNLDAIGRESSRGYGFRHLGAPTGRVSEAERSLAGILADHFFVQVIWVPVWRPKEGKRGSVLEVCGTHANLDLAEYVHGFLLHTAERLWQARRREARLPKRDRRAYLAGVMQGFRERLERQADAHREEGLVWVGDAALERYLRQRHPRVRWTRTQSSAGSSAHAHGRAAGRDIVLHRGVSAGSSGARPLLPRSTAAPRRGS